MATDTGPCNGCRDNFYNSGTKRCWSLDTATMQTLYRIGTWTQPTAPGAFVEFRGYGCRREDGASIQKGVPSFVNAEDIRREEAV